MAIVDQDKLRVTCNYELVDGTSYQNIYHYIRDGVDPYSDAVHIAGIKADIETAMAFLQAHVHDNITEQLSFVDRIEWVDGAWKVTENIGTFTPTFAPSGGLQGLPNMASPFVVFKTIRPKSVGKKFLLPFIELDQANTILTAGAVTAITNYATQILATINLGGDATLTPGIPRTGFNTWYNFLVAVITDVIGSQKRRRPGVGA